MSDETSLRNFGSLTSPWWQRYALHLGIGGFIICTSFLYGLSAGLMKRTGFAFASNSSINFQFQELGVTSPHLQLPEGVVAAPLGRNVTINNRPAEVLSFYTDRGVEDIANEQIRRWKASGLKVIGKATKRRGFAIALEPAGVERYSFSIWNVPPQLRGALAQGHAVQGMLSYVDMRDANSSALDGTIPDVPLKSGGKAGAVFSSDDLHGRTHSGVYTVPGSVLENIHYYRNEMTSAGWHEVDEMLGQPERAEFEVGNLLFQQSERQIVLLLSPALNSDGRGESGDNERTVIAVTEGPRALSDY